MLSVLADGRFSVLHLGHVAYLQECKALPGANLTVRVAPDAERSLCFERKHVAGVVAALRCVDEVVADSRSLAQVVRDLRPDVLCKGSDWRGRLPAEVESACHSVGCLVHYVDATPRMSASALLRDWARREAESGLVEAEAQLQAHPGPTPVEPERWKDGGDWATRYQQGREDTHADIIVGLTGGAGRILDVGCGDGALVKALREHRQPAYGLDPATCGGLVEGEPGGHYGLVISREVLEHLSQPQAMEHIAQLVRVVAPGGRLYVTTRHHSTQASIGCEAETPSADPTHITCWPQAWLRSVLVAWGLRRDEAWESALDWQRKGRVLVYRKEA